jgi:pantoate--beta-alanine ligase
MGALHAGHVSLIQAAKKDCDFVVVSIFVNPTQFGPNEDLARYPRSLDKDVQICADAGVDVIFAPSAATIYQPGFRTFVEVTQLQEGLCGASRPGHFRGVATVVLKLFNIVQPDTAYFGQKDAQQTRIIQQLVADLNVPVRIVVCPIVREPDGLALSSRNQYLDADQRRRATVLYQTLQDAERKIKSGEKNAAAITARMRARIEATPGAKLDYAAIVAADSLKQVDQIHGLVLIALAVWFGATRLIDNLVVHQPEAQARI